MSKKIDFLPALKNKEYFRDTNSVNAIGTEYMDHRDKIKTYMPDKSFKKQPNKWNLQKTCDGELFQRSVRQERDVYDLDLLKYMRTLGRGIKRPDSLRLNTSDFRGGNTGSTMRQEQNFMVSKGYQM
mmetsp:Transcript_8939/g.15143  ORF Transcript_8939/g.15143 Transcript_8939/m.15143 type:complete len:127 (+) Transcript_8939:227-607(+)